MTEIWGLLWYILVNKSSNIQTKSNENITFSLSGLVASVGCETNTFDRFQVYKNVSRCSSLDICTVGAPPNAAGARRSLRPRVLASSFPRLLSFPVCRVQPRLLFKGGGIRCPPAVFSSGQTCLFRLTSQGGHDEGSHQQTPAAGHLHHGADGRRDRHHVSSPAE